MNVSIDKSVFDKFNEQFAVGIIHCSKLNNSGSPVDIHEMLRDVEELIRINFNPSTLQTHQLISAWDSAVAHFGDKAQHYQSNVERMMLDILDSKDIPSKNKMVDLCNFISLKNIIPLGLTDTSKISGSLTFTLAKGSEKFEPDGKLESLESGELILRDDNDVLARKLDYRTSSKADVDKKTKEAIVHIEAIPPITKDKLEAVTDELAGLIRIFCGGKIKKKILNKDKAEVEL